MKILFVNRMLTLVRGGGETFDLEVGRALSRKGCQIHYLSGGTLLRGALLRLNLDGFEGDVQSFCLRSPFWGWFRWDKVKGGWRVRAWEYRLFERKAVKWLLKHAEQYDIIQVCELPYVVAELKRQGCKTPLVMRLTAPNYGNCGGGVEKADAIIASGMTMSKLHGGARCDAVNVPNSIDATKFCPRMTDMRAEWGIGELEYVLLYVARFQDFKDHETLIRAFNAICQRKRGVRLLLAGSGHMEPRIRELVDGFKLRRRVTFLGEVPYEELPAVYCSADVKVISSTYESFCFAAIEAMACELPVITTDNGWVPRLLGRPVSLNREKQ